MPLKIDALLDEISFNVGTLRQAKQRFSDQLAPEFSIFDYFRSDEMALSNCLAGMLDPNGRHGQGNIFLRAFFETIFHEKKWTINFDYCKVVTEKQANGQRRIDIYLEFIGCIIGIENKPWAADQDRQLNDYSDYLEVSANGKEWFLIYLCNAEPSEKSLSLSKREKLTEENRFIQCNYSQLIVWLDVCRSISKALPVRIFIEEIIKFVRININGELEMSEENEARKTICASKNHLTAAFDIYRSLNSVKQDLLKIFRNDLSTELGNFGFSLAWDDSMTSNWKSCSGFGVKFFENQDLYLRFEFEGSGLFRLFWGIRRETDLTKRDANRWDLVSKKMSGKFGIGFESEWWPWWSSSANSFLGKEMRDWGIDEQPWLLMMERGENSLAVRIAKFSSQVQHAFGEDLLLLQS
jgi:hypothetical protein